MKPPRVIIRKRNANRRLDLTAPHSGRPRKPWRELSASQKADLLRQFAAEHDMTDSEHKCLQNFETQDMPDDEIAPETLVHMALAESIPLRALEWMCIDITPRIIRDTSKVLKERFVKEFGCHKLGGTSRGAFLDVSRVIEKFSGLFSQSRLVVQGDGRNLTKKGHGEQADSVSFGLRTKSGVYLPLAILMCKETKKELPPALAATRICSVISEYASSHCMSVILSCDFKFLWLLLNIKFYSCVYCGATKSELLDDLRVHPTPWYQSGPWQEPTIAICLLHSDLRTFETISGLLQYVYLRHLSLKQRKKAVSDLFLRHPLRQDGYLKEENVTGRQRWECLKCLPSLLIMEASNVSEKKIKNRLYQLSDLVFKLVSVRDSLASDGVNLEVLAKSCKELWLAYKSMLLSTGYSGREGVFYMHALGVHGVDLYRRFGNLSDYSSSPLEMSHHFDKEAFASCVFTSFSSDASARLLQCAYARIEHGTE